MTSLAIILSIALFSTLSFDKTLLPALVGFIICGAGMIINDYFDWEIDRVNKPEKWKAMKNFSRRFWFSYALFMFFVGISLSAFLGAIPFIFVVFNSFLLFLYSAKLKCIPFVKNVVVSYLVASAFIFGGIIAKNIFPALLLAIIAFLSNVGREIVKDMSDVEGDEKKGIKTLPIIVGRLYSATIATIFIFSAIVLSPMPYLLGFFSINYMYVLTIAIILFGISCFLILISPTKAHSYIKIAMFVSLFAFIAGKF
jgi:geranylgeranylglycerol-phosphate geranylgeranyltransferase